MHRPDTTAAAFRRATMVSPVIMPLLVEGREVLLPPPPPPSSLPPPPPKLLLTGSFLKEGALLRRMVGRGGSTAKGVKCRARTLCVPVSGCVREGGEEG